MRFAWLLVLFAAAGGCSKRSDGWAVIPAASIPELRKQCARDFPKDLIEGWTPSPDDIKRVDSKVTAAIARALAALPPNVAGGGPAEYYRQYGGFHRNGRRVLYVNGLRKAEIDQANKTNPQFIPWRTEVVAMCDRGPIYFGAVVDAETGAVDNFEFNGP